MLNFKEFKNKVAGFLKENFSDLPPIAPPTVELKTIDGNVVGVDKLETGGVMTIDGAVPADGDYTLESGEVVTIAGGVISTVSPAEMKEEEKPAEEKPTEEPKPVEDEKLKTEEIKKELMAGIESLFNSFKQSQEQKFAELENKLKGFGTIISDFAETPIEQPKVKDWDEMTPLEKRRATK